MIPWHGAYLVEVSWRIQSDANFLVVQVITVEIEEVHKNTA